MASFDSALSHLSYTTWQSSTNEALLAYRGFVHKKEKEMPSTCALIGECVRTILCTLGSTLAAIPECLCHECNRSASFWTQAKIYGNVSLLCLTAIFNSNESFEELRALELRACLHALFGWDGTDIAWEQDDSFKYTTESLFNDFANGLPLLNEKEQNEMVAYLAVHYDRTKEYNPEFLTQFQQCLSKLESDVKVFGECKNEIRKMMEGLSRLPNVTPPSPPSPPETQPSPIPPPPAPPKPSPKPPSPTDVVPIKPVEVTSPIPPSEGVFRNYNVLPSNDDKINIKYITTTLGTASELMIPLKTFYLNEAGDKIKILHPLRFLQCVFTDKENKDAIVNLKESLKRWPFWITYRNGLYSSLDEEHKKENLIPHIEDFAKTMGIPVAKIQPTIEKCNWDELLNQLIQHVHL